MEQNELKRIIEAILFVSEKSVTLAELKDVIEVNDPNLITEVINSIREDYETQDRGLRINEVAGGFRMATDPTLAVWLNKLYKSRYTDKLTKPSLETLSIIAYKQPITKAEIEAIRGVNVDGVIKTLLERELIRIAGRRETIGRPILYGTTNQFLEYFGLNAIAELPNLAEFESKASELLEEHNNNLEQTGQTQQETSDNTQEVAKDTKSLAEDEKSLAEDTK